MFIAMSELNGHPILGVLFMSVRFSLQAQIEVDFTADPCGQLWVWHMFIDREARKIMYLVASVRLSVRPPVCPTSHGWTVWPTTLIFCMGVDLDFWEPYDSLSLSVSSWRNLEIWLVGIRHGVFSKRMRFFVQVSGTNFFHQSHTW